MLKTEFSQQEGENLWNITQARVNLSLLELHPKNFIVICQLRVKFLFHFNG